MSFEAHRTAFIAVASVHYGFLSTEIEELSRHGFQGCVGGMKVEINLILMLSHSAVKKISLSSRIIKISPLSLVFPL
jgi:hypothetical protein